MRTEYFLTCKKTYYSSSGNTFLNLFKKAKFVKGQKYKVIKDVFTLAGMTGGSGTSGYQGRPSISSAGQIIISNPPYSGSTFNQTTTTSTTTCVTTTTSTTYPSNYSWITYTVDGTQVPESLISEYFYTLKEERQMKLVKLKKLSYEEEIF